MKQYDKWEKLADPKLLKFVPETRTVQITQNFLDGLLAQNGEKVHRFINYAEYRKLHKKELRFPVLEKPSGNQQD